MSVFTLHSNVLADYRDFVRSFFSVADDRAREFIDRELVGQARLWPEALLQVSPSYARVASVDELADRDVILRETAQIFRNDRGEPFVLYQHQVEAMERASRGESYVVTSGTGSGKSLTYFLPIIDAFLRRPPTPDRVGALVVYPMNALVNSQLEALKKLKRGYEQRTGSRFPVSFAKYTGDVQGDARRALQTHPPQILLTNYVMAELMLVRPDDQSLLPSPVTHLPSSGEGLRFLIFAELHTYRGRQGADVAMLIRRLKERCAAPDLTLTGVGIPISMTMDWNPNYSNTSLPAGTDPKTVPDYWIKLTTPVPPEQGLPHFSNVHIWNIKATGARRAFSVSAYPNVPLINFKFDHLDIQAASAGSIANAQDWAFSDIKLTTTDNSAVKVTNSTNVTGLPAAPAASTPPPTPRSEEHT